MMDAFEKMADEVMETLEAGMTGADPKDWMQFLEIMIERLQTSLDAAREFDGE